MKKCAKCGKDKPYAEFNKNISELSGLARWCKACKKIANAKRYADNSDGCGQPLGDNYHRDHIMPIALGGSNTDENIQLLRAQCNLQKSAKHPIDFMQQRGFLL